MALQSLTGVGVGKTKGTAASAFLASTGQKPIPPINLHCYGSNSSAYSNNSATNPLAPADGNGFALS